MPHFIGIEKGALYLCLNDLISPFSGSGVVNIVLFFRRWRSTPARIRAKRAEENHEAWICTRVAFSLIGMAPIAR